MADPGSVIRPYTDEDRDEVLEVWSRASRPYLELDVFKANVSGRRFYDAYGFEFLYEHVNEATGQTELRLRLN